MTAVRWQRHGPERYSATVDGVRVEVHRASLSTQRWWWYGVRLDVPQRTYETRTLAQAQADVVRLVRGGS